MASYSNYTVVYDISSNRERLKLAKLMRAFGFRVQKSVFECKLKALDKKKLIEKLEELNIKTGWVKIYRVISNKHNTCIGAHIPENPDDAFAFII